MSTLAQQRSGARPDVRAPDPFRWAGRAATALALAGLAAACGPADRSAPGPSGALYALNALDGTLTPLDAERLAPAGPPIPVGDAPAQVALGPGGSVLVLAFSRNRPGGLTQVAAARAGGRARPVPLAAPLYQAALAAAGGRYAVVAHHLPERLPPAHPPPGTEAGRCRLTLLDLTTGEVRTRPACAPGEQVVGLAYEPGPGSAGSVAYLGIWDAHGPPEAHEPDRPRGAPGPAQAGAAAPRGLRDRVVAVDARSGRVLAARALASPPEHLQYVPRPGGAGAGGPEGRLYVLEGAPGPESDYSAAGRWRLLGLNPVTLDTEQEAYLSVQIRALTVAPDGLTAYALAAGGKDVLRVDLASGASGRLGALPGATSGGLAVTARHLLAPNPQGREVWALDRRDGRLAAPIPVGRRPVAVVAPRP